jgi:acyl-CoA dehydrogenase
MAIVHITRRRPHDTNEERSAVDFAYTPEQLELRARARALADEIAVHESACEEHNGLPQTVHSEIADRVRHHRLNAINMPAEWGGQGLSVVE